MSDFQKFLDQALKNVDIKPLDEDVFQEDRDIYEEITGYKALYLKSKIKLIFF